jgi:hypothetical protein
MKEYFPQFSNEINTQDKLVYKLFASILRREINLSDATSIQQQRLGINLGKLATEITEQRAKIESLINRVKSTTEKTKLKDIYKELHGSPLIQIPDTICNKTIPSTPIQKDSQMKLLLDSILRFIQLIINFIQELFTPSSEEDIMVKKLKKCQKASEPIVQLNKEYQSILNECRFVGNFLKTSNISIFDVEHSTENSEVLNAFLNNRNLTFSAKEKESIQWIKSIMTGDSSQYDGQFAVDRGRSILIFEENGEEVLNSTPYNTPGFSENEQTNKTRKNQLEQTFEKINNWTQVNSASQFLIYILLCQAGLYPLEAFVQKKQMSLGKLSPNHLMLTSGVLGESKVLTYKINKKRNK